VALQPGKAGTGLIELGSRASKRHQLRSCKHPRTRYKKAVQPLLTICSVVEHTKADKMSANADRQPVVTPHGVYQLHVPDPRDFFPPELRREVLLDDGQRVLIGSTDLDKDWTNEIFFSDGKPAKVVRELKGEEKSEGLRPIPGSDAEAKWRAWQAEKAAMAPPEPAAAETAASTVAAPPEGWLSSGRLHPVCCVVDVGAEVSEPSLHGLRFITNMSPPGKGSISGGQQPGWRPRS